MYDECPCDPADLGSCPEDFICQPADDGSVCVPEASARRPLPSCFDEEGHDVFAAEANGAVSVSWKVNGDIDHRGGFSVLFVEVPETFIDLIVSAVKPKIEEQGLRASERRWQQSVRFLQAYA